MKLRVGSRLDTQPLEDRGQRVAQRRANRQWDRCHDLCISDLQRDFPDLGLGPTWRQPGPGRDHYVATHIGEGHGGAEPR